MKPGIVTLTTDFGVGGPYVAAMKGVLLGLAPGTQIVDVCHTIAPQNILEGAFVLAGIVDVFPAGTVHLVVIDPGVGTDRRLIAARLADQWFVLPDNGLITGVARGHAAAGHLGDHQPGDPPSRGVRHVPRPRHPGAGRRPPAPRRRPRRARAAGLEGSSRCGTSSPTPDDAGFVGEVIFRDNFGNLITNVNASHLADVPPRTGPSRSPASGSTGCRHLPRSPRAR